MALPAQVLVTHIDFNILIEESDLDYILKFIVGEGIGFNRLGGLSTVEFWPGESSRKQSERRQGQKNAL